MFTSHWAKARVRTGAIVPFGVLAVAAQLSGAIGNLAHISAFLASTAALLLSGGLLLLPSVKAEVPETAATSLHRPTLWASLVYVASVSLLIVSQKPGITGLTLAFLMPVIACALYGTRSESAVTVTGTVIALSTVSVLRSTGAAATSRSVLFLAATAAMLSVAVHSLRSRLKAVEEALREQAHYDPLTGAANRRGLYEAVAVRRGRRPFVVVSLDVNHLKVLNDSVGHGAGDELLRGVARACQGALRAGDVLARLGGDEFAAFIADATPDDGEHAVARMRDAIASVKVGGETASVSMGWSAGRPPERLEDVLARADAAMYAEKRATRASFDLTRLAHPAGRGAVRALRRAPLEL